MKPRMLVAALVLVLAGFTTAHAATEYMIDTKGSHAFIEFRIKHLGYSWLYGRFNDFTGRFTVDEANPGNASVEVTIKTASVDTNHAERDKHLRGKDFLHVDEFPEARFVSTGFEKTGDTTGVLTGELSLHGVTRPVEIAFEKIGEGKDPWGGYRYGLHGTTTLKLADYGIDYDLGPASREVELTLSIEGIRK